MTWPRPLWKNRSAYLAGPKCNKWPDRMQWKRSVQQLFTADQMIILKMLIEDGLLLNLQGKTCPMCNRGPLGKLQLRDSGLARHRCNSKSCQRVVTPQHLHPLFATARALEGHSLQVQSAALLMCLANSTIHILTKINYKALERLDRSLAVLRKKYVDCKDGDINLGKGGGTGMTLKQARRSSTKTT